MIIGNPGIGKSSFLNGIVQRVAFKAGFAEGGRGVTQVAQEEEHKGIIYVDTPGLTDAEDTFNKAKEITSELKQGGECKFIFMVKQQQGRVVAQDQVMIERVLTAAPQIGQNYGIIVNQVTPGEKKHLEADSSKNFKDMVALLCRNVPPTKHVILNLFDQDLDSETNVVKEPSAAIRTFLESVPPVYMNPQQVKDVDGRSMQQMAEEIEMQNNMLAQDPEKMKQLRFFTNALLIAGGAVVGGPVGAAAAMMAAKAAAALLANED
mmetsp:Transcript_168236/g.540498  ORF Transcript_168236/g.540498 Transcript_168236/m.540498 type:complete len:264 (+) Transcript_168236:191-982(+)